MRHPQETGMTPATAILERTSLFNGLSTGHLEMIAAQMRRRHYDAGQTVFSEGDAARALFVVEAGEVQIRVEAPTDEEIILAQLGPGDAFGELALFDDAPRSASAVAVVESTLFSLDRDNFLAVLDAEPALVRAVLASLAAMIRRTNEMLADVAMLDVHGRMAKALLGLAERHGRDVELGTELDRPVPEAELAGLTGLHRLEVARLLREYEYDDILRREGDRIVLRRPDTLRGWL
jgi:CRP-like cAMP-binding protein